MNLKITNVQISKYAEEQRMPTLKELADNFCEDDDFQYVQETSEVARLEKISSDNPTSIYTKLKAYPFEFEINSSLQLASVDGVKVASTPSSDTVSREEYNELLTRISALETTGSTNPAGTVISYMADTAPTGYLPCNGQEVSRTTYSNLFSTIGTKYGEGDGSTTFNVPDLRGEFLRGAGENSTTGHSGANVGIHQNATNHVAIYGSSTYSEIGVANTSTSEPDTVNSNVNKFVASSTKGGYNDSGITGNSFTSRPTNTSVLYCIKY